MNRLCCICVTVAEGTSWDRDHLARKAESSHNLVPKKHSPLGSEEIYSLGIHIELWPQTAIVCICIPLPLGVHVKRALSIEGGLALKLSICVQTLAFTFLAKFLPCSELGFLILKPVLAQAPGHPPLPTIPAMPARGTCEVTLGVLSKAVG